LPTCDMGAMSASALRESGELRCQRAVSVPYALLLAATTWAIPMSLSAEILKTVALAAGGLPGPRLLPWPMPGRLDATVPFSTYADWEAFFLRLELSAGIPRAITAKYNRALKLHLLAWIDFDIIKAGEMAALTTLELAVKDRYGGKVSKDQRGNISFKRLLLHMVEGDGLADDKLPMQRRCGLGSIVMRVTGEAKPSLADLRNDLAHGYLFDGLPCSGLLEVVRDLIDYAYRDMIAEYAALSRSPDFILDA
jgi:hypothetical protein